MSMGTDHMGGFTVTEAISAFTSSIRAFFVVNIVP